MFRACSGGISFPITGSEHKHLAIRQTKLQAKSDNSSSAPLTNLASLTTTVLSMERSASAILRLESLKADNVDSCGALRHTEKQEWIYISTWKHQVYRHPLGKCPYAGEHTNMNTSYPCGHSSTLVMGRVHCPQQRTLEP